MVIEWLKALEDELKKGIVPMVYVQHHNEVGVIGLYVGHDDKQIKINSCINTADEKYSWDEVFIFRVINNREAVGVITQYAGFVRQMEAWLDKAKRFPADLYSKFMLRR